MTQKRQSRTKFAILGFLASKPRSGYDLKKTIEKSVGFFWNESYGQIYPILTRLVEDGLALKLVKDNSTGRNRQQYAITPAGDLALQNWIRETADHQTYRNELLLKLFFGNKTDVTISLKHLYDFRDYQTDLHKTFLGFKSTLPNGDGQPLNHYDYLRVTLNYGIDMTEASIKWAENTIQFLNKKSG